MNSKRRNTCYLWCVVAGLSMVLVGITSLLAAQDETFTAWLTALRTEALTLGIRQQTLDIALPGIRFQPLVVELDRKQPEGKLTYGQYLARVLPPTRVQRGGRLLQQYKDLLNKIGAKYRVQPRFIVALWGIESDFGQNTGNFPVLSSLATLAYDGRRGALFRHELLEALQIVDEGHIAPQEMVGSWAGAMGQSQFMPSSFRRFAIDYNGDGRRDIWKSLPDVFASIANYLSSSGWHEDETWGRQVSLPAGFDYTLSQSDVVKPLADWQALGVRRDDGRDLPVASLDASLVLPNGTDPPVFLVYNNYRVLLTWNRSHYFATTVSQFADRLAEY